MPSVEQLPFSNLDIVIYAGQSDSTADDKSILPRLLIQLFFWHIILWFTNITTMKLVLLLSIFATASGFVLQGSQTLRPTSLKYRKEDKLQQNFVELKKPV